jgi:hypothetical protein
LPKSSDTRLPLWIVLRYSHQDPDPPHTVGRLGANHERPSSSRAAEQRD